MKQIPLVLGLIVLAAAGVAQAEDDSGEGDHSGFSGGVDVTYFDFTAVQGAGGGASNIDDYFPDYDSTADARLWFGYEWKNGVGVRARYFQYDESETYNSRPTDQKIEMIDLEVIFDMRHGGWTFLGTGGFRWGTIELLGADFGEANPMNFDGSGLTLGFEVKRAVGGGFSLLGGARYSSLRGDTDFQPVSTQRIDNTIVDVHELRFGFEWGRKLSIGQLVVGLAWEDQTYGTDTYFPFAIDPETLGDVGLSGPVVTIGITR